MLSDSINVLDVLMERIGFMNTRFVVYTGIVTVKKLISYFEFKFIHLTI